MEGHQRSSSKPPTEELLGEYLAESESLQAKQEQIWEHTQTVADTIGMSPDIHLGLALNLLEHLPTTPTGLSFTSSSPLLMAHSSEVLAYQGEGTEGSNFQLIESNQKMQQLLTVPESTTARPNLDASVPAETSGLPTGSQAHQSSPASWLRTGLDSLSEPETEHCACSAYY